MLLFENAQEFVNTHKDSLFDKANVFVKNDNNQYLICNNRLAQVAGLDSKQMRGKSDKDLCWTRYTNEYIETDKICIKDKLTLLRTDSILSNENKTIPLITMKAPVYNHSEKIVGIFGISLYANELSTDVTLSMINYLNRYLNNQSKVITQFESKFTGRELECCYFLCLGLNSKAIARILDLSIRTIETYIESIKLKLQVSSKTEMIVQLHKSNVIDFDKLKVYANSL